MRRWTRALLFVLVLGSASHLTNSAYAADAIAVADEIVAAVAGGTRAAFYEAATEADEIVTITGFVIADEPNGAFGDVAEIIVVNPVMRDEGGFIADSIRLVDGNITDGTSTLAWNLVELGDIVIPPTADLAAEAGPLIPLAGLGVTQLVFVPAAANDVVIGGIDVQLGEVIEGVPYVVSISATDVALPIEIGGSSDIVSILRSMGFGLLLVDIEIGGTFDSDTDTLFADSIGIDVDGFGRFEISGVFSGLPLGNIQEPGGFEEILASAMVESVRIRFEDTGAMDAFLRVQAEMTGVLPEDVAFGLAFVFQAYLQSLENPELERQVGAAVGAFLRDPQTLTLVAGPDAPVPLLEIVGLVISAPTILPTLLELVVTAND